MNATSNTTQYEPALSRTELDFFHENGYIVVPNAVPQQNCENLIETIFQFLGVDRNDPKSWYQPPVCPSGNVEIYQHQTLWDNRQSPRVHAAFADVYNDHKLWVSLDRAAMRPPQHPDQPRFNMKLFTHWDMDVSKITPDFFAVQGVLCLNDAPPELGGFTCVPGFHKIIEEWLDAHPEYRESRLPDVSKFPPGYELQPIPAKAGDLIIWDMRLPHGNGYNTSNQPRLAQYISMYRAGGDGKAREDRIQRWRERQPASWGPGDERGWEQQHGQTAELSPLGRKLLGLDLWDES
jgi:ectoine hydroxylase-related dioxygenase (phytanoyl-CoA dioxygenase family)